MWFKIYFKIFKTIFKHFLHPEILYTKGGIRSGVVYLSFPIKLTREEYRWYKKGKNSQNGLN